MLFSSLEYIFLFLPLSLALYFAAWRAGRNVALGVLLTASLIFYGYWNPAFLLLLLGSKAFNFLMGEVIRRRPPERRGTPLKIGLAFNLTLLFAFKYLDFAFGNLAIVFHAHWQPLHWALPLGISFFTFQQIAYLVDCSQGIVEVTGPLEYFVFVTFFPQLIAGPIVHHADLIPQLVSPKIRHFQSRAFSLGLFLFVVGLCKKTLLADTLGTWANLGFDEAARLSFAESWLTALSYTFQLYFDFSGYSDMAIGAALMFNICLPLNFASPYKSPNITIFWRRWHMTLSRWLRDYVYIPLGGSRGSEWLTYRNLFITFLVGGIWHGAGWTFILWGVLHGSALILHKILSKDTGRYAWFTAIPNWAAIAMTFLFNIVCWVIFRAKTLAEAGSVFCGMIGMHGLKLGESRGFPILNRAAPLTALFCLIAALVVFLAPNSQELEARFKPNAFWFAVLNLLLLLGLISANTQIGQEFLYFDF